MSRKKKKQWLREKTANLASFAGTVASMATSVRTVAKRMMESPSLSSPDLETEAVEATRVFAVTATSEGIMRMIVSKGSLITNVHMLQKKKMVTRNQARNT